MWTGKSVMQVRMILHLYKYRIFHKIVYIKITQLFGFGYIFMEGDIDTLEFVAPLERYISLQIYWLC